MKGVILQLKKRHQSSRIFNPKEPGYLMWGYYDQMDIIRFDDWQGLEPTNTEAENGARETDSFNLPPFHEEYQLKLIEPFGFGGSGDDTDYRFRYDMWNVYRDDSNDVTGGDFIVIGMLHFNGSVVRTNAEYPDPHTQLNALLQRHIKAAAVSHGISPTVFNNEICCATYYTTGFSDMVVLFHTLRLDLASDILFALRTHTLAENGDLLLSTSYLMCGRSKMLNAENISERLKDAGKCMRFSIRFLLKPGVSPEEFYNELINHARRREKDGKWGGLVLPSLKELENGACMQEPDENALLFSQMYGYSDLLLLPNVPINQLIGEYVDKKGFLHPEGRFYHQYIASTRTSLRRIPQQSRLDSHQQQNNLDRIPPLGRVRNSAKDLPKVMKLLSRCLNEVNHYIDQRKAALAACQAINVEESPRQLRGMRHAISLYRDIAQPEHAYDIRSMLDPVMETLRKNMALSGEVIGNLTNQLKNAQSITGPEKHGRVLMCQTDLLEAIHEIDDDLSKFRHEFNELLLDLLRADRQFIEGRGMLHSSVGSATKLIIAYSQILKTAAACLSDDHGSAAANSCSFLLSCGGTDRTQAEHFFSLLTPHFSGTRNSKNVQEHLLLEIRLPERTLFRTGAAVFFLMHEMLHYVGFRDRENRALLVQQSITAYVVFLLADKLYTVSGEKQKRLNCLLTGIHNKNEVITAVKKIKNQQQNDFEQYFYRELCAIWDHPKNRISGAGLYSRNLIEQLIYRFNCILAPRYYLEPPAKEPEEDGFVHVVAKRYYRDMCSEGEAMAAFFSGEDMPLAVPYNAGQELSRVQGLSVLLQKIMDILLGNYYVEPDADRKKKKAGEPITDSNNEVEPDMDLKKNKAEEPMIESNIFYSARQAVRSIFNAFKETFSDAMAYTFLQCSSWEYLAIYLYENEVPLATVLSPMAPHIVLRLGGVLAMCDPSVADCLALENSQVFDHRLDFLVRLWGKEILDRGLWGQVRQGQGSGETAANVYAFVNHIGDILRCYRNVYRFHGIAGPLETYIKGCLDKQYLLFAGDKNNDKLRSRDELRSLFHKGMAMFGETSAGTGEQDEVWHLLLKYWMLSSWHSV